MSRGLAVVTGASAGIGREFAEQLAGRGYDLLLAARDGFRLAEAAAALTAKYRVEAEPFPVDLIRDEDVTRLAERIAGSPRLVFLVNNAGFGSRGKLAVVDPGKQIAMVRLHVLAPMRLTLAALPVLLAKRTGAIVNVSSIASFVFSAGNVNYCATKAYLTTFTEGLAAELRGTGVQAQALCPGFTRTEFHGRIAEPVERHPEFMWMPASSVVKHSLRCLDRDGPTICIPGVGYRMLAGMIRITPRRLLGWFTRRHYRRV